MHLNEIGHMARTIWNELPSKYPGIDIDESVIMPNHIHGIIMITTHVVGAGPRACPECKQPRPNSNARNNADCIPTQTGHPQGGAPTLPDIVHRYKSFTTSEYRTNVVKLNWPLFPGKLWQRNYYERIIRNESEMNRIRQYVIDNPLCWNQDENNPANYTLLD
jgi:putative transposase